MSKILFVVTAFAPKNVIGSIRPSKMAKYLIQNGHEVTVVMPPVPENEPKDPLLEGGEMDQVERVLVSYGAAYGKIRKRYKDSKAASPATQTPQGKGLKLFLRFAYTTFMDVLWARRAKQAVRQRFAPGTFDAVLSSYPNIATHWVAGNARKKGVAKRWVADFRDPMVYEWQPGFQRALNRFLQRRVEKKADAVTVVAGDIMQKFPLAQSQGKLHWISNGFDPTDLAGLNTRPAAEGTFPGNKGQLIFAYAGGLYGGKRDLRVLFSALDALIQKGVLRKEDLVFRFAGSDLEILKGFARPHGLEDIIAPLGRVDRQTALSMQQSADILVICSHNTRQDQGILTGKAFETLMLSRPVLTLINGDLAGSELGRMMDTVGAGLLYEEADHETDYPALLAWLEARFVEKRGTGQVKSTLVEDKKQQYSYERITLEMYQLMKGERA